MDNWRPQKAYCTHCEQWHELEHRDCPAGSSGSHIWLELDEEVSGCDKCGEIWNLEDGVFFCDCGHVQPMEYEDGTLVIEEEDEVLAVEGDVVYVQRQSGAVVVGYRTYLNCGYD